MKNSFAFLVCCCLSTSVFAGGYRVSIQGQKALGMGHTGVAIAESAEAVFFNPGAITHLPGELNLTAGLTLLSSKNRYQNVDTGTMESTDTPLGTPVNFYITKKYNDDITYGFGLYTPYGSKVEWEKDWVGSHLINDIDLQAIFLQPTLAYRINDKFSIGGGPTISISSVDLNRNLSTSLANADGDRSNVTLEDSGIIDYGFALGLFYKANDRLNLGLSYRSKIEVKSEGDADFENIPGPLSGVFVDGGYVAELPLPAELTLGLSYRATDKLLLAADINYTFWDAYETLRIEFESVTDPDSAVSDNPRNYKNSAIYRLGLQYQQTDKLQLRAGLYYDRSPIRDGYFAPETPRTDSIGYTVGFTYELKKNLELDFSGLYLYFDEEDNSYDFSDEGVFAGIYKVSAWSIGFGLTYKL